VALQAARAREQTEDVAQEDARRAGIEGTLSRGLRTCERRRTRSIGLTRVQQGHILTAAALNVLRLGEWVAHVPRAKTRTSPFTLLIASPRKVPDFTIRIKPAGDPVPRPNLHCE